MNNELEKLARSLLKKKLKLLTPEQFMIFKRFYFHKKLDIEIKEAASTLPISKMDWALTQIDNTLNNTKPKKQT